MDDSRPRDVTPTRPLAGRRCLDTLTPLLPPGTVAYVTDLLDRDDLLVRLARPRRSKLGDHRPPGRGVAAHRISLNADLNPFALLTTLVHEVAHADAWGRRRRQPVRPHGPEWQEAFARLLGPLVAGDALPDDVRRALLAALERPRAATCSDRGLLMALARYDRDAGQEVFAEAVAVGGFFRVESGALFRAGPMMRTRRQCFAWPHGDEYRVHGLARVVPVSVEDALDALSVSSSARAGPRFPARLRPRARPRRRRS
jgi:SprT protein